MEPESWNGLRGQLAFKRREKKKKKKKALITLLFASFTSPLGQDPAILTHRTRPRQTSIDARRSVEDDGGMGWRMG